jgi:predicted Zn-dependent protease
LLDAHIQPRGTPAQSYAAGQQALAELLKQTEKDPLDTPRLRESAIAWQTTGEIGLRAGQTESACRYLGLAVKRYAELEKSGHLNAIDKLRLGQVQGQAKACG